jgi:hypothetical protein
MSENLFEKGFSKSQKYLSLAFLVLIAVIGGWLISKGGLLVSFFLMALPFIATFLYVFFRNPTFGIYTTIFLAFAANGLNRYLTNLPLGLSIDIILAMTFLALLLQNKNRPDWSLMNNPLTWASVVWFVYNILEIFNPEARSFEAWFYAMRGVALYMLLAVPLTFILLRKPEDLSFFIQLWFIFSILGSLQGIKQQHIGVDRFEQAWLDAGAAVQHVLFGKLRVFSFYSDAGQFGASQAHTAVVATILALYKKKISKKIFYFYVLTAVLAFYGMMISGTRGAMAVPAVGFFVYFILSKNFKVVLIGIIIVGSVFVFLKYTFIGQNIPAISRMRTALDPNDASLLVRIENQKKLAVYLASRPFGGGVGSAGSWGMRFSPNSFLAQTPTDSWYVRIWAEYGIVGLFLHIGILLFVASYSGYHLWNFPDCLVRQQLVAIYSGMWGIFVASYGNGILGQMPTGILLYIGMAFLFSTKSLMKYINEQGKTQMKKSTT